MTDTKTIPLYISSEYRTPGSTSSSDFKIALRKDLRNLRRVNPASVEYTNTLYNIDTNNNTLYVVVPNFGHFQINTLPITVGVKTFADLATEVETELNTIGFNMVWTVTYDDPAYPKKFKFEVVRTPTQPPPYTTDIGLPLMQVTQLSRYMGIDTINGIIISEEYKLGGVAPFFDRLIFVSNNVPSLYASTLYITSTVLSNNINTSYIESENKTITLEGKDGEMTIYESDFENFVAPLTPKTATVPPGSYQIDTMIGILSQEMSDFFIGAVPQYHWTRNGKKITVTQNNPTQNYLLIESTSPLLETLGFTTIQTGVVTGNPSSGTAFSIIEGASEVDLSVFNNVIGKVPLPQELFGSIVYNQSFKDENDLAPGFTATEIDIQLRYPDETVVTNSSDWSMTLLCDVNS